MIEQDHPALSIGAQCRLLSISRSSFYHEPAGETEMDLGLMRLIDRQFLDTPHLGRPADDLAFAERGPRREPEAHPAADAAHAPDADLTRKPNTSKPRKGHKTYPCLARAGCGWIAPVRSGAPTSPDRPMRPGFL